MNKTYQVYNSLKKKCYHAVKGQFAKNLITLGTGTILAQLIPIAASPILTRLYTPDQFGVFANFNAILALLLVFFTGKYERAIILPKSHEKAINIVSLSFFIILFFTFITTILFSFFGKSFAVFLNIPELTNWLWIIPLAAFLASTYLVVNEWFIRLGDFKGLVKNKLANTFGITMTSLTFGLANLNIGLVMGQISGQLFSVQFAVRKMFDKNIFKFITALRIKYYAKKHVNFAKYLIPAQLMNTVASQAPIFIITSQFGLLNAGVFAFTDRILSVPISFVGNSFRDVFKQRAAVDFNKDGNCLKIYKKVTITLVSISIIPFIILFITAPFLFSFIFGSEWYEAGVYGRYLCVMYFISFISMPTSWVFVIAEKQKLDFLWQVIFFVCTAIPILIGVYVHDISAFIISLSAGRSIAYLVQLRMTYILAKGK
tara:strand:+ start:5489 stop:6778 length:1290 start_codon:yes stop_codon:yes gene_type:complete